MKKIGFFVLLSVISCSKAEFNGRNDSSGSKPGTDDSKPPINNPPPCVNDDSKTIADLLTKQIINNYNNQFVEYEISLVDCNGNSKDFATSLILFDVNAKVEAAFFNGATLPYEIKSKSKPDFNKTGNFFVVVNEDLFGNVGSKYLHFRTEEQVSFPKEAIPILLSINLSNHGWHDNDNSKKKASDKNYNYPSEEPISSFVKLGDSTPVEQQITFLNK